MSGDWRRKEGSDMIYVYAYKTTMRCGEEQCAKVKE
jgi:hypothetical protein